MATSIFVLIFICPVSMKIIKTILDKNHIIWYNIDENIGIYNKQNGAYLSKY